MARAKHWCFTLNNPTVAKDAVMAPELYDYLVVGEETGESGTRHFQGYVVFAQQLRLNAARRAIPRAHWEVSRGTPKEASDYCKKQDPAPFESGELPRTAGEATKSRYAEAVALAKANKMDAILDNYPDLYLRHEAGFRRIAQRFVKHATLDSHKTAIWIHGAPRTGKSMHARSLAPDAYIKNHSKWWDGYDGQDDVIIDDLDQATASGISVANLKVWLDRYEFPAEIKGGTQKIRPKRIIITSNYAIEEVFPHPSDSGAIYGRCDVIAWPPETI